MHQVMASDFSPKRSLANWFITTKMSSKLLCATLAPFALLWQSSLAEGIKTVFSSHSALGAEAAPLILAQGKGIDPSLLDDDDDDSTEESVEDDHSDKDKRRSSQKEQNLKTLDAVHNILKIFMQ